MPGPATGPRPFWHPAQNMTNVERVVRVLAGAALVVSAWHGGGLLAHVEGLLLLVTRVVLVLGAVDLLVSGAVGFCPVYRLVRAPWAPRTSR